MSDSKTTENINAQDLGKKLEEYYKDTLIPSMEWSGYSEGISLMFERSTKILYRLLQAVNEKERQQILAEYSKYLQPMIDFKDNRLSRELKKEKECYASDYELDDKVVKRVKEKVAQQVAAVSPEYCKTCVREDENHVYGFERCCNCEQPICHDCVGEMDGDFPTCVDCM